MLRAWASRVGIAVLLAWSLLPIYWIVVTSLKAEKEIYALPPTLVAGSADARAITRRCCSSTRFPLFLRNSFDRRRRGHLARGRRSARSRAYAITRMRFAGRALVARGIVAAYLLPPALLFIPLFIVLQRLGLIDSLAGWCWPISPSRCRSRPGC